MNNNNLYSQFTSNSNKGMVWKLLCDYRAFEGIADARYNLIKDIFDKKISLLAEQINESSDRLVELNKKVISDMIVTGNNYKQQQQTPSSVPEIYNASAISEQRQQKFQDELSKKQNDFDSLSQIKIPDKPNFSDTLDTPIGSEMDKLLAQQIALRKEQLNGVFSRQNTEEAKKWLELPTTNENTIITGNNNNTNDTIVKLKIGENVNLELNGNNNSPKKQVSFSDALALNEPPSVDPDNFMALLKKKPTILTNNATNNANTYNNNNNNDITAMLREILDNQKQILSLLKK